MKNKKGFTLIELLAVIVVLAIIALIATPIVMNTIKNAKKGAAERTADNYIKQVETAVAEAKLENKTVPNGTYDIDSNGNLTGTGLPDGKLEIDMSGNKPTSGTIKISNGGVSKEGTAMTVGDYNVKYNQEKNKYEATEKEIIVYRNTKDIIKIGDIIDQSDTSKFTKDPSMLDKNYYLKHVLNKDNKVTESYACAKMLGEEYCLRGGDSASYGWTENEKNYTGNLLILKDLEKIDMLCDFSESRSGCSGGPNEFYAYSDGKIMLVETILNFKCEISIDSSSSCSDY